MAKDFYKILGASKTAVYMRRGLSIVMTTLIYLAIPYSALAAQCGSFYSATGYEISDDMVEGAMLKVRKLLPQAVLSDGSHPTVETDAEMATPLISRDEARSIIDTGVLSIFAESCGYKFEPIFLNLMQRFRHEKKYSDKTLTYIGMLHGYSMGVYGGAIKSSGGCRDIDKERVIEYVNQCLPDIKQEIIK